MTCSNTYIKYIISNRKYDYFGNVKVKSKTQYPVLRTAQIAFMLYFPGRPVQSNTISTSLGRIQPYATINARRLLVHISIIVYSQVFEYEYEYEYDYFSFWTNVLENEYDYSERTSAITTSTSTQYDYPSLIMGFTYTTGVYIDGKGKGGQMPCT